MLWQKGNSEKSTKFPNRDLQKDMENSLTHPTKEIGGGGEGGGADLLKEKCSKRQFIYKTSALFFVITSYLQEAYINLALKYQL